MKLQKVDFGVFFFFFTTSSLSYNIYSACQQSNEDVLSPLMWIDQTDGGQVWIPQHCLSLIELADKYFKLLYAFNCH